MSNTIKLNTCPNCAAPVPAAAPEGLCPKCVLLAATSESEEPSSPIDTSEIPSLQRVAAAFPKLEILELIGRGGMGFVFKARQPQLDRFVALKLLPDKLARDPRFAERFNREGRMLARLNHPNIVSIYDFGATEHFYFLLMEFVEGVNLRQAMQAGRFSPAEALRVVPKICEALQYAHEKGILHRDIKPANILLDVGGQVKIADFGIAKLIGEEKPDVNLTATGAALGTPHYMAPEQLENPSEVDHRADIYSLGVVFYEMLTGELPIGRFAAPSSKTPVGVNVDEVVFRTLEKDRERRYQSAGEMRTQVEHLDTEPVTNTPVEAGPKRRSRWSMGGAALVALSLPIPLLLLASILTGTGGIGAAELWLAIASIGLFGVGGTVLGWRGLYEIRQGFGRVKGLPMGLFAALTWPLGIALVVVTGLALFFRVGFGHAAFPTGSADWAQVFVQPSAISGPPPLPGEVLAHQWLKSPAGTNTTNTIRFTFTNVELRQDGGDEWMAMDYATDVRGTCEEVFRIDGKDIVTRKHGLLVTPEGSPPVMRQRFEWRIPATADHRTTRELTDSFAEALVGKSFLVPEGEQRPLLRLPVGAADEVRLGIGTRLVD
jgi:tRNA A-37 threonylcarbamoyl transferase component Bud32